MSNFCNLHVHTSKGSLLDSIVVIDDAVQYAVNHQQKALAITDHGSMASIIDLFNLCKDKPVKPIAGIETYEVDDVYKKDYTRKEPEKRYHLLLLAKNQQGYQNLLKLASFAGTTGRYQKARIDLKTIKENNWGKGVICSTACMAGRLSYLLKDNKQTEALEYIKELQALFDDVYIELQSHDTERQAEINQKIYQLSKGRFEDKLIITSDAHMINDSDREIHRVFVATGQSREVGETYKDCFMQDDSDVKRILKNQFDSQVIDKCFENINRLVDSIEVIDVGLNNEDQMPTINVPKEFDNNVDYLKYLIKQGLKAKKDIIGNKMPIYINRIKQELPVIIELGYVDYFLMMRELILAIKENHIPTGYARGSAGGCLILYLIGVTQLDSIKWQLDFSRFANLGRKGHPPDVDTDVSRNQRGKVISIIKNLFGEDKVCNLGTYNTMTLKVALRDVGKVLDESEDSDYYKALPYDFRNEIAKIMPELNLKDKDGKPISKQQAFKQAINENSKLKRVYQKYPKWFEYSLALAGLPKSRGKHASAIIVSPRPTTDYVSLCLDKDGQPLIENDMSTAMEIIKLIKIDLLGLKTLDIVDDTLKYANLTWQDIDIDHLNVADDKVYNTVFKTGETIGVFQFESVEARNMCIKANASNIEDLVVVNAANRPGTKDQFPDYCKNKLHPEETKVIHPDLKEIFKQSHSVMMYQEQALALLRYAGFPEIEVDAGRRGIAKKKIEVMEKLEPKFKQGLLNKGWTEQQANKMWDLMVKQSSYSFNRSHAVAYSLLSYLTAYLKTYYPLEFMTALLVSSNDNEKTSQYINACSKFGIKVILPNINKSLKTFTMDKENNNIMYGLKSINSFKDKSYDEVVKLRPFSGLKDYLEKTIDVVDKASQMMLIKAGALSSITNVDKFKQIKYLYHCRYNHKKERLKPIKKANKTQIKALLNDRLINESQANDKEYCTKIFNKNREKQGWEDFRQENIPEIKGENVPFNIQLQWEFKALNTYVSGNPFDTVWLPDWSKVPEGQKGRIGGTVIVCKANAVKKGKSKGQKMAFINLDTRFGVIDCVCFADKYKYYMNELEFGNQVVLICTKQADNKAVVDEVQSLAEYISDTYEIQKEYMNGKI